MTDMAFRRPETEPSVGRDGYSTFLNPELFGLLSAVDLDAEYVRGEGTTLYDASGDAYLDFAGAYGALPLGHNPAAVWRAVDGVRRGSEPAFVQPSVLPAAGELAARLVDVAPSGLGRVTFVNSGAEAVEIAIKIARSATGRLGILSTRNSFHGKTLGALSATGNEKYQVGFGAPVAGFDTIPFGDADALEQAFVSAPDRFAVFVVEPIQGEGGVVTPPPGYLTRVRELCTAHGVLMAVDEVQTGLGRTGRMFACEHESVVPDILAVAKALGGGLVPAGAVLCRPDLVGESFALRHTSTFAGGALTSRVGLAVLGELTENGQHLIGRVRRRGELLKRELQQVASKYPTVITDVRGEGLLLGVEFTDDVNFVGAQSLIGSIADQQNLAVMIASYMLRVEGVRIAPTLFGARVLRVEPPLTVTESECRRLVAALERAVAFAAAGDLAGLMGHLVGHAPKSAPTVYSTPGRRLPHVVPHETDHRFGFLAHPLDLAVFGAFDDALSEFSEPERGELLDRFAGATSELNPAPMVIGSGRVVPTEGAAAHGSLIGIPFTSSALLKLPPRVAVSAVAAAVDLAFDRGAEVVGLGGYSSVITGNGLALGTRAGVLTTGNSFTAAASIRAVRRVCAERGIDLADMRVTVLGAAGAIGKTIARALASDVGTVSLVGRPGEHGKIAPKLWTAAGVIVEGARGGAGRFADAVRLSSGSIDDLISSGRLEFFDDPRAGVARADIVIAATSAPHSLIDAEDLGPNAIVCDVAQPPNISHDVGRVRPDVTVFDGGIVRLPEGSDFGLTFGLAPGLTYACMAETMLLSLSREFELRSIGTELVTENVERLGELGDRYGFELAEATRWREVK
ncbi:aminotransferase class III-fold pyridoxal phosphate-dependent enzyme [Rhodococcoides kyotonense]|uniref:Acetylornithine/succinyldiaminopimelate/putrescine aminotransferase n=1 Tax=Rhodococcoides kyotonense TaxID=398843 RepID=A0A239MLZ4_9NOCA|nr:aminotransferase class III-fold pyridoxal phosphate-dependent enzyme [Rhodococcus kyotonensis]SNT43283.1 Acetylornithine/succinyldiaminopimelate/putrescine aminotransferase [Rhodococcus kyotonensis]